MCASTGKILSTGGMAPAVGVGGVIKAVYVFNWRCGSWRRGW